MTPAVRFEHVSRHFGNVRAVDDVTLDIAAGEFFAMLGPSGSGKDHLPQAHCRFRATQFRSAIDIFGENAVGVPPYRRNVNTVFQDYALFPHMTVLENVGYGLMVKGAAKSERDRKAAEALDTRGPAGLRCTAAFATFRRPAPARGAGPGAGQ